MHRVLKTGSSCNQDITETVLGILFNLFKVKKHIFIGIKKFGFKIYFFEIPKKSHCNLIYDFFQDAVFIFKVLIIKITLIMSDLQKNVFKTEF